MGLKEDAQITLANAYSVALSANEMPKCRHMAISSGSDHIQDPIVLMAHSDRLQRFSQRRDWLFPSNVRSEVISIR